ncbi:hypothetical protein J0H58_35560 [bacterium]|nr:hypothetical protein [bacterium]
MRVIVPGAVVGILVVAAGSAPSGEPAAKVVVTGTVFVSDAAKGGRQPLASAVVDIAGLPPDLAPPPKGAVSVVFKDKRMVPPVSAAAVKQPVAFTQADKFDYRIWYAHSAIPPAGATAPSPTPPHTAKFDVPGLVLVRCVVNPEARGYVVVTDSSQHAVTDERGQFRLPHPLPPGTYPIRAWRPDHEKAEAMVRASGAENPQVVEVVIQRRLGR